MRIWQLDRRGRRILWAAFALAITAIAVGTFFTVGYPLLFEAYTGVVNGELTFDSSTTLTDTEFEALANEMTHQTRQAAAEAVVAGEPGSFSRSFKVQMLADTRSFQRRAEYPHIKYFREAGIRRYEGPSTCQQCHETMSYQTHAGDWKTVDTLESVVDSVHFKFQTTAAGFSTYGYDGREVNGEGTRPIPVGKINRACGIPGSFSWTGWAALIETKPAAKNGEIEIRSEGCGQCHIGGNYHPATEKMMPVGDVPMEAKQGIDCLICHSQTYDMNYKYVIEDDRGLRWNQDRTLRAAMSVTQPTNENCLNCHQHNMGGDTFEHNVSAQSLGYENKRILHPGAKRANPFSPETDVHYAAGIQCLDCHQPEGHLIPRGTKGTDLVANDLPGVEVSCESCHTSAPHLEGDARVILNGHVNRLACETCHITHLEPTNVVLRDWTRPLWDEEEGIYTPTDVYRSGEVGKGFIFLWFNGNGTFLANALGDNPVGDGSYNPLMEQMTRLDEAQIRVALEPALTELLEHYDIDVDAYIEEVSNTLSQLPPDMLDKRRRVIEEKLRPLMRQGESKIYPFKLFNARMYEDMSNRGPFGAMILPFDYPTYYETGNPLEAMKVAIQNPIVRRMYELPFKAYMMDEFMYYFGVDGWSGEYPLVDGELRNVEAKWMRQMGTLMVNHGIQKQGRLCADCHTPGGIMDFDGLGYPPNRVQELVNLPELEIYDKAEGVSEVARSDGR